MPYSLAMAAVESGRRLQTPASVTSAWANRPGMCRSFVLPPAPMRPMRKDFTAMTAAFRPTSADILCRERPNETQAAQDISAIDFASAQDNLTSAAAHEPRFFKLAVHAAQDSDGST